MIFCESSFAFSKPMCLIPKEYIIFSSEISLDLLIEYFKLATEVFPHPSNFSIFSYSKYLEVF